MKIYTNGHRRDILYSYELSDRERSEFDWVDDWDSVEFFRYRGEVYCLSEFMRIDKHAPKEFQAFDGYLSDSFFSGILVKYPKEDWGDYDTDHIIVATYIS